MAFLFIQPSPRSPNLPAPTPNSEDPAHMQIGKSNCHLGHCQKVMADGTHLERKQPSKALTSPPLHVVKTNVDISDKDSITMTTLRPAYP